MSRQADLSRDLCPSEARKRIRVVYSSLSVANGIDTDIFLPLERFSARHRSCSKRFDEIHPVDLRFMPSWAGGVGNFCVEGGLFVFQLLEAVWHRFGIGNPDCAKNTLDRNIDEVCTPQALASCVHRMKRIGRLICSVKRIFACPLEKTPL